MSRLSPARSANLLIAQMSDTDFALIESGLERYKAKRAQVIVLPNEKSHEVWFPESGLFSQGATTLANRRIDVCIFGRDGFGPTSNILSANQAPFEIVAQIEGVGMKISTEKLFAAFDRSPSLRELLLRYVQTVSVQAGFTALSNSTNFVGERLARWLLMCHDRVDGDDLQLTHELLSAMLGVRRPGVTHAIHLLEEVNIIRATRGNIRILDRDRLEETAGGSYGVSEAEYHRLLGPTFDKTCCS